MELQWYPGHMKQAREAIKASLRLVDLVVEARDGRVPATAANPELDALIGNRLRVVALTKTDLACPQASRAWLAALEAGGQTAVGLDLGRGKGVSELLRLLQRHGQGRPVRAMVVGLPNAGKSSLLNALVGRRAAATGAKAGVTRGEQWVRLRGRLEVLDTPGLLWPRTVSGVEAFRLALVAAVGEGAYSIEELARELVLLLRREAPGGLEERYGWEENPAAHPQEALAAIGRRRGCLGAGGQVDLLKASQVLVADFRRGRLGRFTLDPPPGPE